MGGDLQISIDACMSSMQPHSYLGISAQGTASVLRSAGNADCHVILRGGSDGPNYEQQYVADAVAKTSRQSSRPALSLIVLMGIQRKSLRGNRRWQKTLASRSSQAVVAQSRV